MFISIIFYLAIYCEVKAAGAQLKKKKPNVYLSGSAFIVKVP